MVNWTKSSIAGINLIGGFNWSSFQKYWIVSRKVALLPTWAFRWGETLRSLGIWAPVLKRFQSYLAPWKGDFQSLGDRITLVKATLANLSIYYLSVFKISKRVAAATERLQRIFLRSKGDKEGFHNISWNKVCKSIEEGGIDMWRILGRNRALLGKAFMVSPIRIGFSMDQSR